MSAGARFLASLEKASHDRATFSCGVESLDTYLKRQAAQDQKRNVAHPYVLTDVSGTIHGYYTLSSSAVTLERLPEDLRKGLPAYPLVGVVLLGRLATDRRVQGQGVGKVLLADALERALKYSQQIASWAVVVDAIDDNAVAFYQHFGFLPLPGDARSLVLPMKTIAQLL